MQSLGEMTAIKLFWSTSQAFLKVQVCKCVEHACVLSCSVCPTLCDPMDHSPPGSSVNGIFPAQILEWVAMLSSRGSS